MNTNNMNTNNMNTNNMNTNNMNTNKNAGMEFPQYGYNPYATNQTNQNQYGNNGQNSVIPPFGNRDVQYVTTNNQVGYGYNQPMINSNTQPAPSDQHMHTIVQNNGDTQTTTTIVTEDPSVKAAVETLANIIEVKEAEVQNLYAQIDEIKNQQKPVIQRYIKEIKDHSNTTEQLDYQSTDAEAFAIQLADLQKIIDANNKTIEEASLTIIKLEEENEKLKANHKNPKEVRKLEGELDNLVNVINKKDATIKSQAEELKTASDKLAEALNRIEKQNDTLNDVSESVINADKTKELLNAKDQKIAELEAEIKKLQPKGWFGY